MGGDILIIGAWLDITYDCIGLNKNTMGGSLKFISIIIYTYIEPEVKFIKGCIFDEYLWSKRYIIPEPII